MVWFCWAPFGAGEILGNGRLCQLGSLQWLLLLVLLLLLPLRVSLFAFLALPHLPAIKIKSPSAVNILTCARVPIKQNSLFLE